MPSWVLSVGVDSRVAKLDSVALSYEAQKENSTTSLADIWCYRAVGLPKNTVFSRKTAIYNKIPIPRKIILNLSKSKAVLPDYSLVQISLLDTKLKPILGL